MKLKSYITAAATVGFGLLCSTIAPSHGLDRSPTYGSAITSGNLAHGGRYVFTPTSSMPLTAVELWYAVPSIGYGPAPSTSIARLAAQSVAASEPSGGTSLGEFVSSVGGTLSIDVFPDSVAISALVPSPDAAAAVHLMTQNYFSPVVTEAGLHRAKLDLATQAVLDKFDPDMVIRNGLMAGLFAAGPAHYPTLDIHDLSSLEFGSVKAFAERAFQTQRASLVVSGMVAPNLLDSVIAGHADSDGHVDQDGHVLLSTVASKPVDIDIPFNQPGSGFAWVGPNISDEAAATAMDFVADYLFHPTDGKVTRQLATAFPEVAVNGQFITLRQPGVFVVSLSGPGSDAAAKIVRQELAALASPLPSDDFARAQNAFIYHLQSNLQTPADFAASIGWYAAEGRPAYAPGADGADGHYFHEAAALSPKKIADAVGRFLTSRPVTVTLQPTAQATAQEKSH